MLQSVFASFAIVLLWTQGEVTCEKDRDTCIFYYWQVDWKTAMKTCSKGDTELLCYKTKKEMDDITEAFRLTAIGTAKLAIWLSSRNCTGGNETEECLSLHIRKSGANVWHYFQTDCEDTYPFVCCVNGAAESTTPIETTTAIKTTTPIKTIRPIKTTTLVKTITSINVTSSLSSTSDSFDITDSALATTTHKASSLRVPFCKKIFKRGVSWPNTDVGKIAVMPCPGNSSGEALWACEPGNGGKWKESGPDLTECRSIEIRNLKERFNSSSASDVIADLESIFQDHGKEVFGEDLADIISLMTALPDRLFNEMEAFESSVRWKLTRNSVDKVASIVDHMVELEDSWHDISKREKSVAGTNLLSTVDGMGSLLADSMPGDVNEQSIIGKNMALQVLKPKLGESVSLPQWVVTSSYSHRGRVTLESGYDSQLITDKGNISLVFALYNNMTNILSPTPKEEGNETGSLNSAVVSAIVTQKREAVRINKDVRILMEHSTPNPNNSACVFWNMDRNLWDTTGCRLDSRNETFSVCRCDHLTNFALLMDYGHVLNDVDQDPFNYITIIGCSFSIVCLAICVIVFSCFSHYSRHSWGVRYIIHRNLCLTLLIGNLLLVCGLDKTENQKVCALIAGLLHYFFLSAFSWMLLEGVHIYLLLVVVFASRKSHSEKYYLFGYGFPLVIVIITYLSRPTYYGTDDICWLSVEKGTIWGFMGPVAAILILNTAALILAQYKASRISVKDDKAVLIKRWLRVTLILFPVLGITWVFGFLYIGKHFEVVGYIFAIFNSFQGVCIFVFHCLLDKKARNMIVDSFKKKSTSINTGSSGTQKRLKGHPHNGIKANSITPLDTDLNFVGKERAIVLPRKEKNKRDWSKWRKPWCFCFEMPVSENSSKNEQNGVPQALVVQWNSIKDKSCT